MNTLFDLAETFHGKHGHRLFVATPLPKFGKGEFRKLLEFAAESGGYYSDLRGGDKIAGFQFRTLEARSYFLMKAKEMALASVPPAWQPGPRVSYVDGEYIHIENPAISRHKVSRHP